MFLYDQFVWITSISWWFTEQILQQNKIIINFVLSSFYKELLFSLNWDDDADIIYAYNIHFKGMNQCMWQLQTQHWLTITKESKEHWREIHLLWIIIQVTVNMKSNSSLFFASKNNKTIWSASLSIGL